jgi:hypothetical protein
MRCTTGHVARLAKELGLDWSRGHHPSCFGSRVEGVPRWSFSTLAEATRGTHDEAGIGLEEVATVMPHHLPLSHNCYKFTQIHEFIAEVFRKHMQD